MSPGIREYSGIISVPYKIKNFFLTRNICLPTPVFRMYWINFLVIWNFKKVESFSIKFIFHYIYWIDGESIFVMKFTHINIYVKYILTIFTSYFFFIYSFKTTESNVIWLKSKNNFKKIVISLLLPLTFYLHTVCFFFRM